MRFDEKNLFAHYPSKDLVDSISVRICFIIDFIRVRSGARRRTIFNIVPPRDGSQNNLMYCNLRAFLRTVGILYSLVRIHTLEKLCGASGAHCRRRVGSEKFSLGILQNVPFKIVDGAPCRRPTVKGNVAIPLYCER